MHWTRSKPTQPGWYWWRKREGKPARIIKLDWKHRVKRTSLRNASCAIMVGAGQGQWAGPISEPEE